MSAMNPLHPAGGIAVRVGSRLQRGVRRAVANALSLRAPASVSDGPPAQSSEPPRWRPAVVDGELVQPSDTTCGSSSLVVARLVNDEAYRGRLTSPSGTVDRAAFVAEVRRTHCRTSAVRDQNGRWQLPWLPMLGTTPWAVARAMNGASGAGRAGRRHRTFAFDPADVGKLLATIVAVLGRGDVVPLFVGSTVMARHVVLVTDATATSLELYDPAGGSWQHVLLRDLIDRTARIAGWTEPWFAVLPIGGENGGAHLAPATPTISDQSVPR